MNQKISVIVVIVLLVAAIVVGMFILRGSVPSGEQTPITTPSPTPEAVSTGTTSGLPATTGYAPALHTVRFTDSGIEPDMLTIRTGDAVRFLNTTTEGVWPASDPHPTHTDCPGFDAMRGLLTGEDYTLTFPVATTCAFHDHLDPSNAATRGTIIIQ